MEAFERDYWRVKEIPIIQERSLKGIPCCWYLMINS